MIQKLTLTILWLLVSLVALHSQEIPTPDYSARPYYLKADNTLENFERADATMDTKLKGGGFGGVEMYFAAFGTASSTRFAAGNIPRLFIKLEANIDPNESITLSQAEVKKDRRRFLQGSMSAYGAARNTSAGEVKLTFKKIREGVFEILLPSNIASGEYAFMPMGDQSISLTSVTNIKISCFGIDGTASASIPTSTPVNSTTNTNNTPPQTPAPNAPTPDFDNVIYYHDPTGNVLTDLERAINSKSESTFGFLNFNGAVSIKNTQAPVSIQKGTSSFIVRLSDGTDPYTLIELMPCVTNTEKQTREFIPAAKKDQPKTATLPLKIKRLSGNTYQLTPITELPAGEYFFINKALKEKSIFAFGVK